jgi:hypothetical protein
MADIESQFSKAELREISFHFKAFDKDNDGSISSKELKEMLSRCGEKVTDAQVKEYIKEADENSNGQIEYHEFLKIIKKVREGGHTKLGAALQKTATVIGVQGETGKHSYSVEETEAFTEFINMQLKGDKDVADLLPVKPSSLFEACSDGVLLCKLINACVPGTIDERVINFKKKKNAWEKNENQQLAINSAQGIGCSVVNIGPNDLIEGRPHIVLGLIWQIIKIGLLQDINLKEHPELVRLLGEGESLQDLLKLPPEQILIRWVNYQLKEAGSDKRIKNFGNDIKDSEAYTILLKQICPNNECDLSPLKETDPNKRAEKMLLQADKIGARKFVTARDVVAGNNKLNLAFVANLFNMFPALEKVNVNEYAELMDFDSEGTREERVFRLWIQSLGIDCNNLFEESKDGLPLIKAFDKVQPGLVDWKKVDQNPKMKFHKIQNDNYVVDLAEKMKFSTVNVGGTDIFEGNKKIILSVLWQLMRQNLLNMLKAIGGGQNITEDDVLKWANEQVAPKGLRIESFKDPSIKTGVFLCELCAAVSPNSVKAEYITGGETEEDAKQNAKYAISVARKIGATVFLLYEDIIDVKPKMVFSFVASLMYAALKKK